MKEDVFENPVEVRSAVPPPHFDDQRVVLRAQPVVPLSEIRTKLRFRRLLFLCGAFAIAIMLGAASALVAVHIRRAGGSNAAPIQLTTNTQPEANTPETETVATQSDPQIEQAALVEQPTSEQPVMTLKKETPVEQRPRVVAREIEPLPPGRRGVEPSEEEQLEQIRESVLYDQWQERRARRAWRRERRNRGDRDLSRVDEIFEGPRRPERPY